MPYAYDLGLRYNQPGVFTDEELAILTPDEVDYVRHHLYREDLLMAFGASADDIGAAMDNLDLFDRIASEGVQEVYARLRHVPSWMRCMQTAAMYVHSTSANLGTHVLFAYDTFATMHAILCEEHRTGVFNVAAIDALRESIARDLAPHAHDPPVVVPITDFTSAAEDDDA